LDQKITEDGESRLITCPGVKCGLIVDEKTVELLVPNNVLDKYETSRAKAVIDLGDEYLNILTEPNEAKSDEFDLTS
jgi:ariadne-1